MSLTMPLPTHACESTYPGSLARMAHREVRLAVLFVIDGVVAVRAPPLFQRLVVRKRTAALSVVILKVALLEVFGCLVLTAAGR